MIYLELFISFFKVGLFAFGGGYAAMPLIKAEVVDVHNWLTLLEFADIVTISQMTPGPIGINGATFVGLKVAGILGAIAATLGCVLPSCAVAGTLAFLYMRYKKLSILQSILKSLRPAVVAMIAVAGIVILKNSLFIGGAFALQNLKLHITIIFIICVILLMKYKKNPIFVMMLAGVLNLIYGIVEARF